MKKLLALGFAVLFVCTACAKGEPSKKEAVLKIGILDVADSGALFVAERDKIFEKHGCKVELVEFSSAADQSKAAEAGQIDGMMTDLIVQSLNNKGKCDFRETNIALGDTPEHGRFIIAASPKGEGREQKGLEGATIAISEDSMMEFLVDSYAKELKVPLESIHKVNVPSLPLRLEMLLEGKVECAILPEPLGDFAVMKGARVLLDDTTLPVNLSQSVIVIDQRWIEKHRDLVQAFVSAYAEAAHKINENPSAYSDYIMQRANVPESLKKSYHLPFYSEHSVTDPELFGRVQDWMVQKKLLKKAYDYKDLVDASFVQKIGK